MKLLKTKDLLTEPRSGNPAAFETIYRQMAARLLHYVDSRIRDVAVSEEIVQEIFVSLWLSKADFNSMNALESYLFKASKYQILNHIRSEKVRSRYIEHLALFVAQKHDNNVEQLMDMRDLNAAIEQHIQMLPPKCQEAFRLSRFKHKSIAETAQLMGISTRTVENYLTQARKHLRKHLSQHQWVIALIYLTRDIEHIVF